VLCLGRTIYNCLSRIADTLEANEERLNNLDRLAGDGDCGTTLKRAAQGNYGLYLLTKQRCFRAANKYFT
jgi:hypothetical protein